jgi:hypothetical protein
MLEEYRFHLTSVFLGPCFHPHGYGFLCVPLEPSDDAFLCALQLRSAHNQS